MKIKALIVGLLSLALLAGCGDNAGDETNTNSSETELPEWVDYAAEATLQLDYEGRDFYVDGVGQMEAVYPIDGDTAHFTPVVKTTSSERIKCRFYGIDTPESTGKVEPWGKAASNYTSSILEEAIANGTVVITGPIYDEYKAPEHDSTGERYLSCIYVNTEKKNAPKEELYLLNLMIVQNGYSTARNVGEIPEFSQLFLNANTQAIAYKLVMHSGERDPNYNYNTEFEQVGLIDIHNDVKKHYEYQLSEKAAGNDNPRPLDGTYYFALSGSSSGADYVWNDQIGSSPKVQLYDLDGKATTLNSAGVPSIGETTDDDAAYTLLGYNNAGTTTYLTGEVANGLYSVTTDINGAGHFLLEQDSNGYTIRIGDEQYLGYDVEGTDFTAIVSDLDYRWTIDFSNNDLTLKAGNCFNNRKVAVQGTVIGYSNHIIYLQDTYENDDGEIEYAAINVFTGMNPINDDYTEINTYLEVKGLALDSQFGFQITDTSFPNVSGFSDKESEVILTPEENNDIHEFKSIEFTSSELSAIANDDDLTYYNTYVKVTDPVTIEGGYVDGNEATLWVKDCDFDIYLTFTYAGDPDRPNWIWNAIDNFKGQSFYVEGVFTIHTSTTGRISFQINPNNADGLQWISQEG